MYVCFCKGIKDSDIRDAVAQGAYNLTDVQATLGVATQCGKCACLASEVIAEALNTEQVATANLYYSVA